MTHWPQNKKEYRNFCGHHPGLPLFMQDWWLDVVCTNGTWEVCMVCDNGGEVIGVLPFYLRKYFGFPVILNPMLTPTCGAWLCYPQNLEKESSRLSFEKKVMTELIEQLPPFSYYAQSHPPQMTNWLPFYWKGFRQTTRYTYRLLQPLEPDTLFQKIESSTRNKIAKAQRALEIIETDDLQLFYKINQLSFERQGKALPYSFDLLENLDAALSQRNQRKILLAKDRSENYHAAIYMAWDNVTVYNLMLGADTNLRSSGAVQWLLWKGIELAAAMQRSFDFEGSMMPNVEPVFRSFGGTLTPYFKIYKPGNLLFRMANALREL